MSANITMDEMEYPGDCFVDKERGEASSSEEEEDDEDENKCSDEDDELHIPFQTGGARRVSYAINDEFLHKSKKRRSRRTPFFIWWMMSLSCLFHHRSSVVERKCLRCRFRKKTESFLPAGKIHLIDILSDNSLDSKEQINGGNSYNSPCHIDDPTDHRFECHSCDSYWWDYDGVPERYTEKDIGVTTWNGPTSRLLSFIILVAVIMEVAYDNVYYIGSIWGKQRQIIHAMSYGTFLLQLVFYPILTLAAKIKSWSPSDFLEISWCTVINDRFMVNRLQFLDLPHNGIPMKLVLLLVYVFPIYLVTLRGWIYLQLCSNFSWHSGMSVFCGGFLVLIWGNFQYLLYLTRCSFQRQLHVVLEFIETHQDNTDACRRVLGSVMKDFAVFKKFVDMYMVLMIPTSIWSITTTVVWLYYLSFEKTAAKDSKYYWWFQRELVLLISSENIYHLTLNLWAFGGVNVGYIWNHFYLSLNVAARNSCSKRSFWRKIMRHLKNINLTNYGINFTVILSVLSCFVALELGDKQWTLFVVSEPSCNGTFRFLLN